MEKLFNYRTAMELLPQLKVLLQKAIDSKVARHKSQTDLAAYKKRLVMAGGAFPNQNRLAAYADQARTAHDRMKAAIDSIQDQGVEIRDLEQGLLDFPARYQGKPVYLTYQLGEEVISYWHEFHESVKERRPIREDFVENLEF
jgi:hypothetical protein